MFDHIRGTRGLAFLLLLLVSSWPIAGHCAEYRYVSTTGSDLNSGLRPEVPWRTLTWASLQAPADAIIQVAAGVYREDTGGFGALNIDSGRPGFRFIAQGEVQVRADRPDLRVMNLDTSAAMSFEGFTFAGADSSDFCVTGDATGKRFAACTFIGCTVRAVSLTYGGVCVIDDCDFGLPGAPLAAQGLVLSNIAGGRISDSRFHVAEAYGLLAINCLEVRVENNRFGEVGEVLALGSKWALRAVDTARVSFLGNSFWLSSGHGISVPASTVPVTHLELRDNALTFIESGTSYGILVGDEAIDAIPLPSALIAGNAITAPVGVSSRSLLVAAHCTGAEIRDNTLRGGGYGIRLRENDAAVVHGNLVEEADLAGILDKGGHDDEIYDNRIACSTGRSIRLANDDNSGRELRDLHLHHNSFAPGEFNFELSEEIDPALNRIESDWNRYELPDHEQALISVQGGFWDFWALRDAWAWELHGGVDVTGVPPLALSALWTPGAFHALLVLKLSELSSGWLAYGSPAPTDTVFKGIAAMEQVLLLGGLEPLNSYQYDFRFCDGDGDCVEGAGSIETLVETMTEELPDPTAALRLLPPQPNPGNPRSTVRFETLHAGTVRLSLHDLSGRRVRQVLAATLPAGLHAQTLDGRDDRGEALPSGVYLLRVESAGAMASDKWVLLR